MDLVNRSKILASLAVFRQLYDNDKDVYGVIGEFLEHIIDTKGMRHFNSAEITDLLNSTFGFTIPEAVVKSSLGRLIYLNRHDGTYHVDSTIKNINNSINHTQAIELFENNKIIEDLFQYISSKRQQTLTENQKEKVVNSFCSFLLDESNGNEYAAYISSYLLNNMQHDLRNRLNKIREGLLLYSGLIFNNISEIGSWKTSLKIYLDTEVLFNLSGYNGEVFKNQFFDFYKFIQEINIKAKKRLIQLVYFKEVKDEVESFFTAAQFIVEGKRAPDPSKTAMNSLTNGCKNPSEIIEKKSDFYLNLSQLSIFEGETIDYFEQPNHQYNLIDADIIKSISAELDFDVTESLRFLNYISIHRGSSNEKSFENIEHILLTGKSRTLKIAWHNLIKKDGRVPLATTTEWLTNKFWFKLNKGFGNGDLPSSVDVITKAQIMLSSILNDSIGEKYDELTKQLNSGQLSVELATSRLVSLRGFAKTPEDINQEEVPLILNLIQEDSLEKFKLEQELMKRQATQHADENKQLKQQLFQASIEAKRKESNDKSKEFKRFEELTKIAKNNANKKIRNIKMFTLGVIIMFYTVLFSVQWDVMERWTYIFSTIPVILTFVYLFIVERELNPTKIWEKKKEQLILKEFVKLNINPNVQHQLQQELVILDSEIEELELECKKIS